MSWFASFVKNRNEISEDRYACGICEKEGKGDLLKGDIDVYWPSPYSRGAHQRCFNLIQAAESGLTATIDNLFKNERDNGAANGAHRIAIQAVRKACGSETMRSYLEKNGEAALAHLFNTVGVEAAKKYSSSKL